MQDIEEKESKKLRVTITPFAQKHYIKKFIKRNKQKVWQVTQKALVELCENIPILHGENNSRISRVLGNNKESMFKVEFPVAQSKQSHKKAGNRCIVYVENEKLTANILLVYHKNDLPKGPQETQIWKNIIRENFSEYKHIL